MNPETPILYEKENLSAIQKTARTTVMITTCVGVILGPLVSSSKYLTSPAPLGGSTFLSFFAMKIT
jgi:hypothetical protein